MGAAEGGARRGEVRDGPPVPGRAAHGGGGGLAGGLAPFRLRRALDCVENRLAEDVSLSDLATAAGLSPGHFATAFRAATGATPHRYLVGRRVERAKELLAADPRRPVTAVALAVGFGSSAHFATAFRKFAGTTPSAWQRQNAA